MFTVLEFRERESVVAARGFPKVNSGSLRVCTSFETDALFSEFYLRTKSSSVLSPPPLLFSSCRNPLPFPWGRPPSLPQAAARETSRQNLRGGGGAYLHSSPEQSYETSFDGCTWWLSVSSSRINFPQFSSVYYPLIVCWNWGEHRSFDNIISYRQTFDIFY